VIAVVHQQYHRPMHNLCYARELSDADLFAVTYYLLLLDRIDEAPHHVRSGNPDAVPTKPQYDYYAASTAVFGQNPQNARLIAATRSNHLVDRRRNTFAAVHGQLNKIEGLASRTSTTWRNGRRRSRRASRASSSRSAAGPST
jgi:hypothetical protein